jgi:LysM repeat protein
MKAQTGELVIRKGNKGFYLEHKITAKENFYSIGRLYNVHPRHIASFNSLDMSKGLSLGQIIHIPLSDTNFSQKKNSKGIPVYYVVGEKEGLFRVSNNNNNVLMENLRQWNHLENDNVSKGQQLIIGFFMSADIKNAIVNVPQKEKTENNSNEEKKSSVIEKPKEEYVKKEEPKKEEFKPLKEEPAKTEPIQVKEETYSSNSEQGYFKSVFDEQEKQQPANKDQTVTAGIFKTTSGWNDQKYYLLMDGVEPGTVVKIINPSNNKIVYAKVLGEMSGIKQNEGLNIRICNAAATVLQITETDKFIVKLKY